MSSPITTHVLDLSTGQPARGVAVTLSFSGADLSQGRTDADGRLRDLLDPGTPLTVGTYRLRFDTGAYFNQAGVAAFYPVVMIDFEVVDPSSHYHVPLLLSPFGYSTYRGS